MCPDPRHPAVASRERPLQWRRSVTPLVAILTLAGRTAFAAPLAPFDSVEGIDHVALPAVPGPLRLEVRALDRLIAIEAPRGAAALATAARKAPRAICSTVEVTGGGLVLRCRSNRIVARLFERPGGSLLEVAEVRALPWTGPDAPPLVPFDPQAAGLGEACPGSTASVRGECLLAEGELDRARAALAEIREGPALAHASLRLGDLAFLEGDLHAAATHWGRVEADPWKRLAAIRLGELLPAGPGSAHGDALYATDGLPAPLALDVILRHARALAFGGRMLDAVLLLGKDACASAPICQRIVTLAMRSPGAAAVEALALWLESPDRDRGPGAFEAERAAADVAEREGAPAFAANILAAAAARAPAYALSQHLLRTAELYLEAGDRVRAGVVLKFARARAGRRGLPGPRWAAVARSARARDPAPRTEPPPGAAPQADASLEAAGRATLAARALDSGGQP